MTARTTDEKILQTIGEYSKAFGQGCPYAVLSRLYAKATKDLGGLQAVVDRLKDERRLTVYIHKSGRRVLSIDEMTIEGAVKL